MDAAKWVARWDAQQERYLPHREERFRIMLDIVERAGDGPGVRLLDLCCGTGSISSRVLDRFPNASILAVDWDPVHLELGRRTLGERVEWRDADLRDSRWADELEPASFDAVLSATAIHWFQPDEVVRMYRTLGGLLRPGGVFANADHLPVSSSVLAALSEELSTAGRPNSSRTPRTTTPTVTRCAATRRCVRSPRRATGGSPTNRTGSRRPSRSTARHCSRPDSKPPTRSGGTWLTRFSSLSADQTRHSLHEPCRTTSCTPSA